MEGHKKNRLKTESTRWILMLVGAFLYVVAVNEFVVPVGLYSGGIMGLAQLIRTFMTDVLHLQLGNVEIASVIFYLMNLPGLLLARRLMGRLYLLKTIVAMTFMTVLMTLLPIVQPPIMGDDLLGSCIVGGMLGGVGVGLILRAGSTLGGMEVIGVILLNNNRGISIGRVNTAVNMVVYIIMFFVFDPHVAIYSLICGAVNSVAIDRVYSQNINMEVHVITTADTTQLEQRLMKELDRGITKWTVVGAYSGSEQKMLYMIVNKYEVRKLRMIVNEFDSHAFVVSKSGVGINGNYAKHLN
ncbi:MAG: YitT family protein [Lachnospiraceae bacterium]|nr:YitT family protein [Lachnospiraceae bacterium]